MLGVTTVSALLSRILGSAQVPFDGLLRGLCDILAARFGRSGGPRLACVAADEALPIGAVTLFVLIADLLVTDAFVHAFPPGRGGRIAVSFTAAQEPGGSPSTIAASPYDPTVTGATMARRSRGSSSCGSADGLKFVE
jgi:two-component sensor histidine kinase